MDLGTGTEGEGNKERQGINLSVGLGLGLELWVAAILEGGLGFWLGKCCNCMGWG